MKARVRKKHMTVKKDQQLSGRLPFDRKKTAQIGSAGSVHMESLHSNPAGKDDKKGCLLICNDLALLQQAYASFNATNAPTVYADHGYGAAGSFSEAAFSGQFQVEPVSAPHVCAAPFVSYRHNSILTTN